MISKNIDCAFLFALFLSCSCISQDRIAVISTLPATASTPVRLTSTPLSDASADSPHSFTLPGTRGLIPYQSNVVSDLFRPGLEVHDPGSRIIGTPAQAGWFGFTTEMNDSLLLSHPATPKLSQTVGASASNRTVLESAFFGMHIMDPYTRNVWPTVPVGALGKGARCVWSYVETSKGIFDWSRLDAYVKLSEAHGVKMMYAAEGIPAWAAADVSTCSIPFAGAHPKCSGMVNNIHDWDDFITALVTRYKGKITAYELWNEPNDSFAGTVTDMVRLTQHFHNIIRALDSNALVVSPSYTSGSALDSYFAAGGTRDVDVVSFHAYPDSRGDAELIVRSWTSSVRAVMSKYSLSNKPLWNTEASWGSNVTDPDHQAAFIARYYLLSWFRHIGRTYWYAWDNSKLGTLYIHGIPSTKAVKAYQELYDWIWRGTTPRCTSSGGHDPDGDFIYTDSFYAFNFLDRHGVPVQVVWQTSSDSVLTKIYEAPFQFTHYRDLDGNTLSVPANHLLRVGDKPILLE